MNPILVIIAIIACLLSGCQSYYRVMSPETITDHSVSLKAKARKLSRTSHPEAWRIPIKTAAVDEILCLPEHRVLVGLTEAGGSVGKGATFPSYGPYVMYDTQTRQEIWRIDRDSDYETHSYAVRPTQTAILIEHSGQKKTSLAAVALDSGKTIWKKNISASAKTALSPERNLLIIAEGGSSGTLTAVDLARGTTRWTTDYKGAANDGQPVLHVTDKQLLVLQRTFTSLSLKNGRILTSIPDVGRPASATSPIATTNGIIIASADGKISLIKSSGGLAWQATVPGTPRTIGISETACFIEAQPDQTSTPRLIALSFAKGRKLWERNLPGPIYSSLQTSGKALLFSLSESLEMRNVRTGALLRSVAFPSEPAVRLADQLIIFPKHAVLATEKSFTGIRLTDGHKLWSFSSLDSTFPYESAVSDLGGSLKTPGRATGVKASDMASMPLWQQSVSNSVKQAEQNQAYVYQRTESVLMSNFSSAADRNFARSDRIKAIQGTLAAKIIDRQYEILKSRLQIMNNANNFMLGASDMGQAIGEKWVMRADAISARASLPQAIKDHQRTVQGSFLIKPVVAGGATGILVVDMHTGSWVEVPTSPAVFNVYRKFTQVSVAPDGAQLITNGTGLDWTKWKIDNSSSGTETFVYPGILGYNLTTMTLKPPDAYATQSLKVLLKPLVIW